MNKRIASIAELNHQAQGARTKLGVEIETMFKKGQNRAGEKAGKDISSQSESEK